MESREYKEDVAPEDKDRKVAELLAGLAALKPHALIIYAALPDGTAQARVIGSALEIFALYQAMDPRFLAMLEQAHQNLNG